MQERTGNTFHQVTLSCDDAAVQKDAATAFMCPGRSTLDLTLPGEDLASGWELPNYQIGEKVVEINATYLVSHPFCNISDL